MVKGFSFVSRAVLNTFSSSKLVKISSTRVECSLLNSQRYYCAQTSITPTEATKTLRAEECGSKTVVSPVMSYDRNVLPSNNPIEDSHAEGIITSKAGGMLFGVFDGHGGPHCGQVLSKRLFSYITAQFLTSEELEGHIEAVSSNSENSPNFSFVQASNDDMEFMDELDKVYQQSYLKYLKKLKDCKEELTTEERLKSAFLAMDADMSSEALEAKTPNLTEINHLVAMSGAVATVALVQGNMLHIANTGDCRVVLGQLSDNDLWVAKRLTTDHNADNSNEIKRITSEHPGEKQRNIVRGDRLMGMLAPLRAFGDYRFKWPANVIRNTLGDKLGETAVAQHYKTPPYLTAEPEVTSLKLTSKDKFMVVGSDGLWDLMTPMQVIRLVGEHMVGKIVLTSLDLKDKESIKLGELRDILRYRQSAMKLKPADANAATHLIRSALGGSVYGVDHSKLATMLNLPKDMVRMFRDDITVNVVFFDSDAMEQYSNNDGA